MEASGELLYFDWEIRLIEWLQAQIGTDGFWFEFFSALSFFGEALLFVAVMGFLYWGKSKEYGKWIGLNVLMVSVWNPQIKNAVLRLRPYFVPGYDVKLLRLIDSRADAMDIAAQGYSFPSAHSANAVTVYGSLAVREKKRKLFRLLAVLLPLAVGLSRVYVGAHFPTDVVGGWLLGLLVLFLVPWLSRVIRNRAVLYALLLLSALPGLFYCTSNDYFTCLGMLIGFLAGVPFEERFVNFENTPSLLRGILRTLGGAVLFFLLDLGIKAVLPGDPETVGILAAGLFRALRYAVILFLLLGVYPLLFRLTGRFFPRETEETEK